MTRRDSGGTPAETSGASKAAPEPPASKPPTAKGPAAKGSAAKGPAAKGSAAKATVPRAPAAKPAAPKSPAAKAPAPKAPAAKPAAPPKPTGGARPPGAYPARPRSESFLAHRRGALPGAAPAEDEPSDPVPEFEPVTLGGEPAEPGKDRSPERAVQRARLQKEMEAAPFASQIGLRLDYADNGVSRVRLPTTAGNTEPGPLEGGVVGAACVAAGHFAAASLASGVGIRLVEFKISVLGPVQGDLLAIGEVVRKGRTLVACRMEVVEDNDRVVAIGLGTYFLQHP